MRRKNRNLFLIILTLVMSISCMGIIGAASVSAETSTPTFEMIGAGIRLEEPTGIRFGARIDSEQYNEVISNKDKLFGAIILPQDILGETEISSSNDHVKALDGKLYLDSIEDYSNGLVGKVEIDKTTKEPTGYYTISYSITNVMYGNLNREFFGLVYIRSAVEGSYAYEYATFGDDATRTVADVAKAYYDLASDDELAIVENFIYKAEYLANDTTSANYEESELSAESYINAQKDAIAEFKTSIPTETNQSAINASMAKYNALGDFAKTLVATEKGNLDLLQATICNTIKTEITELSSKTLVESDYHKIYGLELSYAALPNESKGLVDNYSALETVKEEYLANYEVEIVYGATETESDGIGKDGQNNVPTLTYDYDIIFGPVIKVSNVGSEQRISVQIKKNYDNAYAGYNLYFNAITSNYAYAQYVNASFSWTTDSSVILHSNTWTQFSFASSQMGTAYNNARHVGFNVTKDGNFMISAVFAIRQTEVGQMNAKIAELNAKAQVVPEEYHAIYGIKTNYQSLSQDVRAKIDYATLLEVESKFLANYEVQVVYGATEAENGISADASNNSPTKTFETDYIYGNTVKITTPSTQRVYAKISKNNTVSYSGYTIYYNIYSDVSSNIVYWNKSASWVVGEEINGGSWTSYALAADSLFNSQYRVIGVNSLSANTSFFISAVFAIRQTEIGQVNSKIAELNNKEVLAPEDYHAIYGIKTNYQTLSQDVQAKINYATLIEVENKFLTKYEVKVVYGGTEAEGIKSSGAQESPTVTYSSNFIYGNVVKFTSRLRQKTYAIITANADQNYEGYKLYFNIISDTASSIAYVNGRGAWEASNNPSIAANAWTAFEFNSSDLYRTYNGGRHIGITELTPGMSFAMSAVFAIREI